MKAITFCLAMLASPAFAGTLTVEWVGRPQLFEGDLGSGDYETEVGPPYRAAFVFSVPYLEPSRFAFSGGFDPFTGSETATYNPYDATLTSRPDGHLGGYFEGSYNVLVGPRRVKVNAELADGDDVLQIGPRSIFEDHNQGQFFNSSSGFWTASYTAGSAEEGESFDVVAAVPLPASLPLLALGGVALGVAASRRTRSGTGEAAA